MISYLTLATFICMRVLLVRSGLASFKSYKAALAKALAVEEPALVEFMTNNDLM